MAGFNSYDDLIQETTVNGKVAAASFMKTSSAPEAAGVFHSLWSAAGYPGAGANPATTPGVAYDDAAGSLFFADQVSDYKFLMSLQLASSGACTLIVYDRLVGVGGVALNSTGNKTINSVALPRYTGADAKYNQVFLEVTTQTATNAPIVTMNSYTNQDGTPGQSGSAVTFPAVATNVDTWIPLPLAAGDTGVQSVETINVGTAGTAGVANLVIARPLVMSPVAANVGALIDLVLGFPPMQRIYDGASLMMAFLANSGTAVTITGAVSVGWG